MQTVSGSIAFLNSKQWGNKTLYSVKLANNDQLFLCGEKKPQANKGDFVTFAFKENAKGQLQADVDSFKVTGSAPTVITAQRNTENWDARAKYWENKEKREISVIEPRIALTAARNSAIAAADLILKNSALKLPAKDADKYEVILNLVRDLTIKFYDEAMQSLYDPPAAEAEEDAEENEEPETGEWD